MILRITTFVALLILTVGARKHEHTEVQEQWQEFEEFLKWKQWRQSRESGLPEIKYEEKPLIPSEEKPLIPSEENRNVGKVYKDKRQNPPPVSDGALMGRYIVNQADWTSVATISTRKDVESFPVVNLISFSDGPLGNGSGVPYMYLTPLDFTAQDLAKDQRATLLMSLAQGDYCRGKTWDPMDPRCARIILTGKIKAIRNESMEHEVAKKAVFARHPKLVNMPPNHHFYFAKLKIISIAVLDTFGGPKYVNVKDYLHPPTPNITEEFLQRFPLKETTHESNSNEEYDTNYLNPVVRNV